MMSFQTTVASWTMGILLMSSSVRAQVPEPAAELAKFDRLLGSWEGKGVTRLTPEGPEVEWTSVSVVTKPLGGFVVQEDIHIEVGDALPAPIVFRTIHAWDAHRERLVHYTMSNVGPATQGVEFWASEDRLVTTSSAMVEGAPTTDQTVTDLGKDEVRFVVRRSRGGEPFFEHLKGSLRKSDKTLPSIEKTAAMVLVPPGDELASLRAECGSWKYEGWYRIAPGADKMPLTGAEEIRPILGGHAFLGIVRGDPMPGEPQRYEEHFYLAWHGEKNAYLTFSHNNYGMVGHMLGYARPDGSRVYVGQALEAGAPAVYRVVRTLGEDGDTARVTADRLRGSEPADRMFEADYTRVPEKSE